MMTKWVRIFALAVVALATPAAHAASSCTAITGLTSDAMFARYPAASTAGRWRAPDVQRGQAHAYRTVIGREGAQTPDFAGHYKVVRIGCGAGAFCPAFVDRMNGRVSFMPALRIVSWMPSDDAVGTGYDRLTYRRGSRLLVVLGSRNSDDSTAGATLYEWRDGTLRLIRFIPARDLCVKKEGA